MNSTFISWEWTSRPDFEDLAEALAPLGIRVYWDPEFVGSDCYGFIFSREDLSGPALIALSEEYHADDAD